MKFEQPKQFKEPKQGDTENEQYVGDTIKRMDEERKKVKLEYAERQKKIHEATGWELVSDKPETVTEKRSVEDIENDYRGKNEDKDFWEIDLVAASGSESMAYYAKSGDSYYVYMRTKEEAEKCKERHKEARKELVKTINETLKEAGFKKKASTWRREAGEFVQIFNLQTSRFAYNYFINMGTVFRGVDKKRPMDEVMDQIDVADCNFRWRLEDFIPEKEDRLDYDEAVDFDAIPNKYEGEPPELAQIEKINEYIKDYAVPFFEKTQTEEKMKEFITKLEDESAEEKLKDFTEEIRKIRAEKQK